MTAQAYERSWQVGRAAVLAGRHDVDRPPSDGGRWGLSLILRPDPASGRRLVALGREAARLIGACWAHDEDALHVTVRSLEPHCRRVPAEDPAVGAYVAALGEVAAASDPVALRVVGLTLASGGVLGCGVCDDGTADALRHTTAKVLAERGADAFELEYPRDMWHVTLAHFTGSIHSPEALVDWVADRRAYDLGTIRSTRMDLVRPYHDGSTMRIHTVASAEFGSGCVTYGG